jgi:hypothetical protein
VAANSSVTGQTYFHDQFEIQLRNQPTQIFDLMQGCHSTEEGKTAKLSVSRKYWRQVKLLYDSNL